MTGCSPVVLRSNRKMDGLHAETYSAVIITCITFQVLCKVLDTVIQRYILLLIHNGILIAN